MAFLGSCFPFYLPSIDSIALAIGTMSKVTEAVRQSLVGSSEQPQLSHQIKANFNQYARKDEQTGDLYMNQDDFINAVAPKQEDYVSLI